MNHSPATVADTEREKERFKAHGIASGWPESRYEQTWGRNGTYEFKHIAIRCDFDMWLAAKADARAAGAPAETAKRLFCKVCDMDVSRNCGAESCGNPWEGNHAAPQIDATTAPAAWRVRIGASDVFGYCETESDANFYGKQSGLRYEKTPLYTAPATAPDVAKDAARLDFIENSTVDLHCHSAPTPGGDDADVFWTVIEHHMAAPHERDIGWGNTSREAIDAAMGALPPTGSEKGGT